MVSEVGGGSPFIIPLPSHPLGKCEIKVQTAGSRIVSGLPFSLGELSEGVQKAIAASDDVVNIAK
ncbi:hypothetical protein [Rubripirellula reticaptiva]|uniref:hypothetical protein n=1 Tax=Rubripirellula reticaptiva TaxID=2528013 RepID=UPI0011B3BF8F|nr:hypothetical protein [Rubripirellula reticaptiva]